ncbi:hypothetical protein CXF68_20320 [Tenacibaculum sp. Bg11-29]|uniref:hypothetical protein n=1 Tax=Tenacibaculum sp. Bg11-29 TaxID=2058306 RepID=UPI000C32E36B|nr:hypothetical protein [Tenacibaculum sp. Bg11-29]PKH52900.1 hypothetical protein CXF68_20320 [Tenacibaculum sp. Bg11-29]
MKELEIKKLLNQIAKEKGIELLLTDAENQKLADKLSNLSLADRESVKEIIDSVSTYIKESVDFTDTNYIIDQIVAAINK